MSILVDEVAVRKNSGANVGIRRRINLIEGPNVALTIADDPTDQEIDVTIAASGGAGSGVDNNVDFLVYKSGGTYYAYKVSDGGLTSSATFTTVINAAIATLTGAGYYGTVILNKGTYTITAGNTINLGYGTRLIGAGVNQTYLDVTGNTTAAITIAGSNDAGGWEVAHMEIDLSSFNGHGIYSSRSANISGPYNSSFHDLYIHDTNVNYSSVKLIAPMNIHGYDCRFRYAAGDGLNLLGFDDGSGNSHYGNSLFENIRIGTSSGQAGVRIVGVGSDYTLNLMQFNNVQVIGSGTYGWFIGPYVRICGFFQCDSEASSGTFTYGIYITAATGAWCYDLRWFAGFIQTGLTNAIWLDADGASEYISGCIFDGLMTNGSTSTYWDTNISARMENYVLHCNFGETTDIDGGEFQIKRTVFKDNCYHRGKPIATPFYNTTYSIYGTSRYSMNPTLGVAAAPTDAREYVVMGGNWAITSTGGTGVSITIDAPDGTVMLSGAATLAYQYVPYLSRITFAYSTPPTVTAVFLEN